MWTTDHVGKKLDSFQKSHMKHTTSCDLCHFNLIVMGEGGQLEAFQPLLSSTFQKDFLVEIFKIYNSQSVKFPYTTFYVAQESVANNGL